MSYTPGREERPEKKTKLLHFVPESPEEAFLRAMEDDASKNGPTVSSRLQMASPPVSNRYQAGVKPFAGFENHGQSCFIAAAVTIVREMERVCGDLEDEGKNPWAAKILSAVRSSESAGLPVDTTKLHQLLVARFPFGLQADAIEFLEVLLSLAFGGTMCPALHSVTTNTISCMVPLCATVVQQTVPATFMRVHIPKVDRVSIADLMEEAMTHTEVVVWNCSMCGAKTGLSVDTLGDPPRYLIVHLVQDARGVGHRTPVHVAGVLRVRGVLYALRVKVYFVGETPVEGHYITSTLRGGVEWLQNDSDVKEMPVNFAFEDLVVAAMFEVA